MQARVWYPDIFSLRSYILIYSAKGLLSWYIQPRQGSDILIHSAKGLISWYIQLRVCYPDIFSQGTDILIYSVKGLLSWYIQPRVWYPDIFSQGYSVKGLISWYIQSGIFFSNISKVATITRTENTWTRDKGRQNVNKVTRISLGTASMFTSKQYIQFPFWFSLNRPIQS